MNAELENNAEFAKSHLKSNLGTKTLKPTWQNQLNGNVYYVRCDVECVYMM